MNTGIIQRQARRYLPADVAAQGVGRLAVGQSLQGLDAMAAAMTSPGIDGRPCPDGEQVGDNSSANSSRR